MVLTNASIAPRAKHQGIDRARAQPSRGLELRLVWRSSGVGATPHFAAEYFKAAAKVDILHVPYKGAGPMFIDLMGGRVEMGFSVVASSIPHVASGKLRALGVSGATRVLQLPQVPTIAEGGVPGYEFTAFYALLVPGRTPREIVARLSEATAKAVSAPDFRERIVNAGMEPVSNTPEQMLQVAKLDGAKIDNIIRTANIKLD